MFFGVLGSLYARGEDGETLPLGGPARRQLLAALVSRAGQTVQAATLIDDLWGEAPPASAPKTLQSHLVRLRRDLAAAEEGGAVIVTDGPGYRLDVPPAAVDGWCFERDLRLGERALVGGDDEAAVERLDAAVAWWRGDAYAEFPEAQFAVAERLRLGELRSLAHERRIDARLRLGHDASVVGDIEARLAVEPYREGLWQELLLALYRSGRQADALAAYQRARTLLIEELGVEPSPVLRELEARILAQDADLLVPRARTSTETLPVPSGAPPLCPYPGLSAFEEADAALFVAREKLTARVVGRLADTDLVVVTGPSGSGKSSLVRAGLLPALRGGGLPGSSSWRMSIVPPQGIAALRGARAPDLLVVDHVEELFTLPDAAPLAGVDAALADLLARGTRLVLVLRGDFYGRLADLTRLSARVGAATLLVPPLTEVELRRVVVEPARRVALDLEPDLVDEVLADVRGQSGALPLLSAALAATWRNREDALLTVAGYRAGGGVRRALDTTAEAAYSSLSEMAQADARRLLVRLATHESGRWTRRPLPRHAVSGLVDEATLSFLAGQRLLTVSDERVELVHEALLDGWPRLHGWLAERAARADVAEALSGAASRWESGGRQESDLYRGVRLQAALEWRDSEPHDVLPVERDFLSASEAATRAELAVAKARVRRFRRLTAVLAVLALVATVGGVVAFRERSAARAAAQAADARRLAAQSLTAPDLRTSLLLAATAYRLQDSPDSRGALLAALGRGGAVLKRIPTPGSTSWVAASPDGRTVWTERGPADLDRWDVRTGRLLASYAVHGRLVDVLSPDGKHVIAIGPSRYDRNAEYGEETVLSADTGAVERVLPVHTPDGYAFSDYTTVSFTADSRWLAVPVSGPKADPNGPGSGPPTDRVAVFDVRDLHAAPRIFRTRGTVAALTGAGQSFAAVTTDGRISLVRARDLRETASVQRRDLAVPQDQQGAWQLAGSPDGRHLALALPTHLDRAYLLDTARLSAPLRLADQLDENVQNLVFSRSSRQLAVVGSSGALDLVRVADAVVTQRPVESQVRQVWHVAWAGTASADTGLFALGNGGYVLSLDLSNGQRLAVPSGPSLPASDQVWLSGSTLVRTGNLTTNPNADHNGIALVDAVTGHARANLELPLPPNPPVVYITTDDRADRTLVDTQDGAGPIRTTVVALPSGRVEGRFTGTKKPSAHGSYDGVISPDGRTAALAVDDHQLAVYSLPDGRRLRTFNVEVRGPNPARHLVQPVTYGPHDALLILDYDTYPGMTSPVDPAAPGATAAPAPTPGVFADKDYQAAALVDLRTGRLLGQVGGFGQRSVPMNPVWSPDGSRLALGTISGEVRVVDGRTLKPLTDTVLATGDGVSNVSWSPDGSMLLVSGGATVSFWDSRTLRQIGPVIQAAHSQSWWWATYLPSGSIVGYLPSDDSGHVRYFTMPGRPQDWLGPACRLAGDTLTRAEWVRYVGPGRAYQRVC